MHVWIKNSMSSIEMCSYGVREREKKRDVGEREREMWQRGINRANSMSIQNKNKAYHCS